MIETVTIDYSPVAQFAIDAGHTVTHWNRACELLTGRMAGEMIGTDRHWEPFYPQRQPLLADLIVDHDRKGIFRLYGDAGVARSKVIPHAWEATGFFDDMGGEPRYLRFMAAPIFQHDGTIVGSLETLLDITEQKRSEQALIQSTEVYRILAENVPDGVGLMQKGRFVHVNHAFAKIFGHPHREGLIGGPAGQNIRPDFREQFRDTIAAIEEGRSSQRILRWPCITRDGREIWAEGHPNRVTWQNEPAVLTTVVDITEIRSREMAIRQEARRLKRENVQLKSSMKDRYRFGEIIGGSRLMHEVYDLILNAAASEAGVIIYGESGTGKELVARAIFSMSDPEDTPFVPVNCGAIPEQLLESEFFGHRKGSFTGAHRDKEGFLDRADGGTLFLDEVGELSPGIQVKLLRAVEGGGYTPVGSTVVKHSRIRIIAATNRNLEERVRTGHMREDFYYRIHVIPIRIPPLRERREDIPFLVEHFLQRSGSDRKLSQIPGRVLAALYSYDWPGNVRELQNALHRYLAVGSLDLGGVKGLGAGEPREPESHAPGEGLRTPMIRLERRLIVDALNAANWNRTKAASLLGIPRKTLFRKMKKHRVE